MNHTITTESGRSFTYPGQPAYEAALDWYNAAASKANIAAYCRARGVEIDAGDGTLVDDWADIAMHVYASSTHAIYVVTGDAT